MIAMAFVACVPPEPAPETEPVETTPGPTGTLTTPDVPFGPVNEWWHAADRSIPPGLAGTGWADDDIAYDFTLMDQHGDLVQLYQFYGTVIVLDIVAMWAGPCADNAPIYEDWVFTEAAGQPISWLALIVEGENGPPKDEDAVLWAETHGLNHAVLADTTRTEIAYATDPFPTLVVIDPTMHIWHTDMTPVDFQAILDLAQ